MREHRNVTPHHQTEEAVIEPKRCHVMRGLDKNITRISQAEEMSLLQISRHIRCDVIIRSGRQHQRDPSLINLILQPCRPHADLRPCVLPYPRQDVWRASHGRDAPVGSCAGHRERHRQVGCAIIHAGKNV